MENTWALKIRTGWVIGLALAVLLIGGTVGLVVTAIMTPLSIWVFLLAVGACLTLGLAIRVLYQLWGLINASYELDRNALVIHWGPVEHQIPMADVREVLSGAQVENLRVRPSLRWPGYFVALGQAQQPSEDQDAADSTDAPRPILFYASARPKHQVILHTKNVAYGVSPADLEGFLIALRERLEMGPTQEVEERSTHPAFLDWPIWQDRWAVGILTGCLALLVLFVGVLCWRYPYLPQEIALRFTPGGIPLLIGPATRIFYLAVLGTIFTVFNVTAGFFLYRRERPLAYFLWSGLLATLGCLWAAAISILLMN
jgi:hypothetical protein